MYYNISSGDVTLIDASLSVDDNLNTTIALGNTSIPIKTLLNATLPYDVQEYAVGIPSPFTLTYNTSSSHNIGIYLGELTQTMFRACSPVNYYTDDSMSAGKPQYLVKNHPLPISRQQALEIKILLSVLASLFILVPLCYIPAR